MVLGGILSLEIIISIVLYPELLLLPEECLREVQESVFRDFPQRWWGLFEHNNCTSYSVHAICPVILQVPFELSLGAEAFGGPR